MYQNQIRTLVALIVLVGHLAVFLAGLLLGIFGPLAGTDVAQTIVMTLPVLGATAMAALSYVLGAEKRTTKLYKVSHSFAFVVTIFPIFLILSIFCVFWFVYIQVPGFGPENMKISLGGIETIFGVFLGAISTKLFGSVEQPTAVPTP